MTSPRTPRLLVLSLLAGAAVSCAGPTSDFPFGRGNDDGSGAGVSGGLNGFSMSDGGVGALDGGSTGTTAGSGGTTGTVPATTGNGGSGDGGVPALDAGASNDGDADAGCHDAGDAEAGADTDAGADDAGSTVLRDAESDAAPDPCEGGEGGTSAGG